ncbi:MAG: glutathione peroxidase [Sphingomonas bacterium]|uniref:glutathione peroxidase n=1 Tax=Sphingomonas bacterium TaxID=1895847 RepID=UPI002635BB2A|nr:glutathione peroxidase [Sphingomonas bacterium]MDB5695581.1 glutathione peroxidase [Sphingomonas bacterium]
MTAITDIEVRAADGGSVGLDTWRGKVLLIVNTASKCGFTPQYEGLEELHRRYGDRGFEVLGFPCNQFGAQEPGDAAEIATFCSTVYDVTFPMFAKVDVNGPAAHPLFQRLKEDAPGVLGSRGIKWNFTKFLIDRDGKAVRRYAPSVRPDALTSDIEALL